jgi:hypothetical protein
MTKQGASENGSLIGTSSARPCISVYFPHQCNEAAAPDPRRLRELLREVEQKLALQEYEPAVICELMGPLYDVCESPDFWQLHRAGLALFRNPGFFGYHAVTFPIPEIATVGDHFHLAPVFSTFEHEQKFYLLALSLTGAKLWEAQSSAVAEIRDASFPQSPVAPAEDMEGRRLARSGSGHSVLHLRSSHESGKQALVAWCRRVDEALRTRFAGCSPPVVLVAVQYLCPMFRHVSRYPNLLEEEIHGSPEGFAPDELWQRGSHIVSTATRAVRQSISDEYLRLWHTPRASNDLRDIEVAARHGRVQTLFIAIQTEPEPIAAGGSPDCDARGETRCDLEIAALNTFLTGGTIYAVPPEEVPGRSAAAAVFRY